MKVHLLPLCVALLCMAALWSGIAGRATAAPTPRPGEQPQLITCYMPSAANGRLPAGAGDDSLSRNLHGEWHSLPAPYNHSVAELNDILSYDTPQAVSASADRESAQETAPFNRNIAELNAMT